MAQERWGVAWDTIEGRAVRIDDGDAERLRPLCKSQRLQCPIEGCSSPALNTVRGHFKGPTWVRDYFRHVRMEDESLHSSESAQHWLSKMHIQIWAESLGFVASVEQFQPVVRRRPDVTITDPVSGQRLHVEVQFSPLTDEEWLRRDADLRASDATVLWLWGTKRGDVRLALSSAQRECVRRYDNAWFVAVNGEEILLACGHSEITHDQRRWKSPMVDDGRALLDWRGTAELDLSTDGPTDDMLLKSLAQDDARARGYLLGELRKRIQRRRTRLRAMERGRNAMRAQPFGARRSSRWERPPRTVAKRPSPNTSEDRSTATPFDTLPRVNSRYASLVSHEHWKDQYVYRPPRAWKTVLVNTFFLPGSQFTLDDAERTVREFANMRDSVRGPVNEFLRHAHRLRHLRSPAPGFFVAAD